MEGEGGVIKEGHAYGKKGVWLTVPRQWQTGGMCGLAFLHTNKSLWNGRGGA